MLGHVLISFDWNKHLADIHVWHAEICSSNVQGNERTISKTRGAERGRKEKIFAWIAMMPSVMT